MVRVDRSTSTQHSSQPTDKKTLKPVDPKVAKAAELAQKAQKALEERRNEQKGVSTIKTAQTEQGSDSDKKTATTGTKQIHKDRTLPTPTLRFQNEPKPARLREVEEELDAEIGSFVKLEPQQKKGKIQSHEKLIQELEKINFGDLDSFADRIKRFSSEINLELKKEIVGSSSKILINFTDEIVSAIIKKTHEADTFKAMLKNNNLDPKQKSIILNKLKEKEAEISQLRVNLSNSVNSYFKYIKNELVNRNSNVQHFILSSLTMLEEAANKREKQLGNEGMSKEVFTEFAKAAKPLVDLILPIKTADGQPEILYLLLGSFYDDKNVK